MSPPETPRAPAGADTGDATDSDVVAVFNDISVVLGVPFVNLIFRRLATWPDYLIQVWRRSAPLLTTTAFSSATEKLRGLAEPLGTVSFELPADITSADLDRAIRLTDMYAYVQPKLLMLTAGWSAGLLERPLPPPRPRGKPSRLTEVFDDRANVPMIDLPPEDPTVARLFEQMVEHRGHPGVASYYRSLATWPTLLAACWASLEPVTASPEYIARARKLSRVATSLATDLGLQHAGAVQSAPAPALTTLLAMWRDVQVPQLMLDTRHLQHGLRRLHV